MSLRNGRSKQARFQGENRRPGIAARPPLVSTTVAPASRRFRGSIARHWDSLSTLRNGGRPPPRKTRFRLLAKLCRAGFVNPQGCNERFPSSSLFPPTSGQEGRGFSRGCNERFPSSSLFPLSRAYLTL